MKLYFAPGTCSLAPHIVVREIGMNVELVLVDIRAHTTVDGRDYFTINPKGSVPLLETDNGMRLTEGPVIAQYLADHARNTDLMPAAGSDARYRVMEWQNYITSELHKSYSPLFNPAYDEAAKATMRAALRKKYQWVDSKLASTPYLTGDKFTAADAYLFAITRWAKTTQVDIGGLKHVQSFMERVRARPAVQAALDAEAAAKPA